MPPRWGVTPSPVGWGVGGYLAGSSDELSQTFGVLSPLPLTIRFPAGLKRTLLTYLSVL